MKGKEIGRARFNLVETLPKMYDQYVRAFSWLSGVTESLGVEFGSISLHLLPCWGGGRDRNGERSLMVTQIAHRNTFKFLGHLIREPHVIQWPFANA